MLGLENEPERGSPVVAASDACKIEHVISTESFAAIKKHIDLNSME